MRRVRSRGRSNIHTFVICFLFCCVLAFVNGYCIWTLDIQGYPLWKAGVVHHPDDITPKQGISRVQSYTHSPKASDSPLKPNAPTSQMTSLEALSVNFSVLGMERVRLLKMPDVMVDLAAERQFDRSLCSDDIPKHEQPIFLDFLSFFTKVFKERLDNLPWWMDEGSLIGVGRAGTISDADDDFDFFALLPNITNPCKNKSLDCDKDEFNVYIHEFLLHFWDAGACINKFHPKIEKFKSNLRLMYSFQLHRKNDVDPLSCFDRSAPFAHMHLGVLNSDGELETNKWVARHSTHKKDKVPLDVVLPVKRCRLGSMDAPCPNKIVGFLSRRNAGEYVRRSKDGGCLLVRRRWSEERKRNQVKKVQLLHNCGYNSMIELVKPFVDSHFTNC